LSLKFYAFNKTGTFLIQEVSFYGESSNIYVSGKEKMNFVERNFDIVIGRPPALNEGLPA
jgi:hypothetical protein